MDIQKRVVGGGHHDILSTIFDNANCQNSDEISYYSKEMFANHQKQKPTNTSNSKCTCNKASKASFLRSENSRKSEQNKIKTNLPNTKNIHKHPKFTCTDNSFNIFSECGFLQNYVSKFVTNSSSMCEINSRTESFDFKNKCSCNFILNIIKLSCIVNLFKKCSFISLILISYILFSTIKNVNANELSPQKNLSGAQETGVCQSVDIRNNPQNLNKLSGCRVVEGFVQILLMDNYQHEAFDNYSFPDLVEITDFLLLFRINGLKTLQKLFPNLAVIRGNSLFQNYALVIYEMVNLQEIALYSLTNITRGAVRIEKNPMLCFVETIDWTLIARHSSKDDHYIVNNKRELCFVCPGGGKKSNNDEKHASDVLECPQSSDAEKKRLCWNMQHCQNVCPPQCGNRACNKNQECCDETCIGGCSNDNVKNCTVCREYSYLDGAHRVCTVGCPNGTFVHMNRRCITEEECRSIKKPLVFRDETPSFPYIPFNGVCTLECPVGHYEFEENKLRWCKKCDAGRCKKVCGAANIDSIQSAQKLRGCTRIDGSLEIQIRSQGGLNIVRELEQSLSAIEEIDGYLKVVRSFPLLSLSFLKRLKRITGKTTDSQQRSLVIMDNQNLQDLWDEGQEVRVESGLLFFYFNPKLCFYKILNFINKNTKGVDAHTLSTFRSTNGEKTACNVTLLDVRVMKPDSNSANSVILSWDALEIDDDRTLLGYVVFYIVAPYQNVTMYDGRDACGGDGWHVDDVSNTGATKIFHLLAHLEPYTQYAYYVKTYTLSTEKNGAQSPIQYFTTSPGEPDKVQKLAAIANSSSEIVLYWELPKKINGKLASFIIIVKLNEESNQDYSQRDYCAEPITHKDMTKHDPERIPKPTVDAPKECDCSQCPANNPPRSFEESEAEQQINFEDHLHNYVYVKKNPPANPQNRIKRDTKQGNESITASTDIFFPSMSDESNSSKTNVDEKVSTKTNDGHYNYIYKEVNASVRSFVLRELKHYSTYYIEVKACREGTDSSNCSKEALSSQRTQKIVNADDIRTFNVMVEQTNNSLGAARIIWASPDRPNGIIVSYTIKYKKVIQDSKPNIICITSKQFANISGSYLLTGLDQGNYSIQIMASSLAGDGNYTPPRYIFIQEEESVWRPVLITIVICVIITLAAIFYWCRRKDQSMRTNMKLIASVNPEYVSMTYQPDEWEVPRENIIQLQELGQGSFGMVYQGIVKNLSKPDEESRCAIKTVNENATDRERINFLKEASVMKAFKTHHVVQLLGVVSSGQPTLVIMELMPNGDLKGYLRSHRPNADVDNGSDIPPQPPTLKRILQMAIEIADGMAYLSAKKFVHRDLAARNCMVAEDLTVKIGDFGMTRDIYETDYYRKGTKGLLPVRWMSPESLKDGVFTSYSDVFSFGVVLWEMATLASQPYQGLSNDQVLRYVIDGGVMERPENCPDKLYDLMRQCWQHRPSARPSFLDIVSMLFPDAHPSFVKVSFYHSPEGQELLTQISLIQKPDETQPLRLDTDDDHDDMMDDSYLDRTNAHLIDENQTRIRPSTDSLR